MSTEKIKTLLESYHQAMKVRVVFWVLLIAAGFAVWGGLAILQTWGLSQADGGVLKPLWQRILFGGFVGGFGLACVAGMWIYLNLYALRITRQGDVITLTTMTPIGEKIREFFVGDVGESAYYHGQVRHVGTSSITGTNYMASLWVNAPWITLRVRGYRLPFILDVQAETIKTNSINRLAKGDIKDLP